MRRLSAPSDAVIQSIKTRLDDFRQQRRVQAGSLIISVFGDAILPRGGRIWLGSLIRLLEPGAGVLKKPRATFTLPMPRSGTDAGA